MWDGEVPGLAPTGAQAGGHVGRPRAFVRGQGVVLGALGRAPIMVRLVLYFHKVDDLVWL